MVAANPQEQKVWILACCVILSLKAGQNIVQKIERLERFMEVLLAGLRFESLRHNWFHDLRVAVPEAPRLLGRSYRRL